MWSARDAMATTSLEDVREREKGLEGRGIVLGVGSGVDVGEGWMCSVESHEAETSSLCVREYARAQTPVECEERRVWVPVLRSILVGWISYIVTN